MPFHKYRSVSLLALALAGPLFAQPTGRSDAGNHRSEIRLNGFRFGNFFQVNDPRLEQDVSALGTEWRAALQPRQMPFEVYGHANFLVWDESDRKNTYGARLGIDRDSEGHDFNFFVDLAQNRASTEVGDIVANANVTTLGGEYSYRLGDWELGGEGTVEQQRFDAQTDQDNDYTALGASVRYRGFGWKFSPEVGFTSGHRSSDDPNESYDEPTWYAQLVFVPHARVYLSARYRHGERRYDTGDRNRSNFGRVDDRPQWNAYGNVRLTERFIGTFYYTMDNVTSTRAGRDFDANLLIIGMIMRL